VAGGRRTANALISGMLFPVVALVAGFITRLSPIAGYGL